jgi:hypothetical protein
VLEVKIRVSGTVATALGWDDDYQHDERNDPAYAEICRAFNDARRLPCGRGSVYAVECSPAAAAEFARVADGYADLMQSEARLGYREEWKEQRRRACRAAAKRVRAAIGDAA